MTEIQMTKWRTGTREHGTFTALDEENREDAKTQRKQS